MLADQSLDFYSTSAQVLPVLAFALLFDVRRAGRDESKDRGFHLVLASLALLFLIAGEVAALHVLSAEKATDCAHFMVTAGYVWGALAVLVAVLGPMIESVPLLKRQRWVGIVGYAAWIVGLIVAIRQVT